MVMGVAGAASGNPSFILLAGYAPDFMGKSVYQGLTVGYCLALFRCGDHAQQGAGTPLFHLYGDAKDIERAFGDLDEFSYPLANAGAARQDIDLLWGATLTRAVSLATRRFGSNFLSVGRVQSPTLGLIVQRELERRAHEPVPFFYAALEQVPVDSVSVIVETSVPPRQWLWSQI